MITILEEPVYRSIDGLVTDFPNSKCLIAVDSVTSKNCILYAISDSESDISELYNLMWDYNDASKDKYFMLYGEYRHDYLGLQIEVR